MYISSFSSGGPSISQTAARQICLSRYNLSNCFPPPPHEFFVHCVRVHWIRGERGNAEFVRSGKWRIIWRVTCWISKQPCTVVRRPVPLALTNDWFISLRADENYLLWSLGKENWYYYRWLLLSFFKGKFLSTQDYYFINDEIFIGWINFGGEGSKKVLAFTRNSIEICIGWFHNKLVSINSHGTIVTKEQQNVQTWNLPFDP